jgi:hypothetical protein
MSAGIILIEDEPLESVLVTWLSWMTVMVIFAMSVIYLSNYFARSTECLVVERDTPFQTLITKKDSMYVSTGRILERDIPFQALITKKDDITQRDSFTIPNPYSTSKQTVGCLIDHERRKDLSGDHYYLA